MKHKGKSNSSFRHPKQVLLFGHTHVPLVDYDGALWVMNPGAAGDYTRPTCGLLTIREGAVICSVQNISLGR